jgi:hypothetical protein
MKFMSLLFAAVAWLFSIASPVAQVSRGGTGSWTVVARPPSTEIQLGLGERGSWHSSVIDRGTLMGLQPSALSSSTSVPVTFSLRRDAGTLHFEGLVRSGSGGGAFTFAPNPTFVSEMAKRGVRGFTRDQQYELALADAGYAFLDELRAQRYELPADAASVVQAAHHGVGLDYVRDMGAAGYSLRTLDALIRLRDHGVTARYVRELRHYGLDRLSAEDLVRARSHGVSADYAGAIRSLGYRNAGLDLLIRFRNHGVSPEYVRELQAVGFGDVSSEMLIRFRSHGVTPREVGEMRALGYSRLTSEELIDLRNHGLSPERIRRINERAGERLSVDRLMTAARRGV